MPPKSDEADHEKEMAEEVTEFTVRLRGTEGATVSATPEEEYW
jgi:hypothetical protein